MSYPDIELAAVESARVLDHAEAHVEPRPHPDDPAADWRDVVDSSDHDSPLRSSDEQYAQHPPQPREIAFEGILRVNGYVAGVLRSSTGHLIVDPSGTVDADILVPVVTIHGCVRGDIRASQRVELAGSAKVIGDIETLMLSIDPGGHVRGPLRVPATIRGRQFARATGFAGPAVPYGLTSRARLPQSLTVIQNLRLFL